MADELLPVGQAGNKRRSRDMGDGSFADVIASISNAKRGTEVLHRSGVMAIDCLATPGVPTATAITEAGSTLANVAYHFAVAAANEFGPTTATVDGGAVTPTANQSLRIVVAQIANALYYDIFLSTAVAPLWVGRITEAQRATGDQIISTVGTTSARAGSTVAGTIDVGIVGTGVASTAAPFAFNNAFIPATLALTVTPVNVDGSNGVQIRVRLSVTDFRSAPNVSVTIFRQSVLDSTKWTRMNAIGFTPLATAGAPLDTEAALTTQGAKAMLVLVSVLAGQGASVDIYVNPVV